MSEVTKEQIIEESQHIAQLVTSAGWKIIENEIHTRKEKLLKALVNTDDDMVTKNLKANLRGLEFLLSFPHEMLDTAKRVTEADTAP